MSKLTWLGLYFFVLFTISCGGGEDSGPQDAKKPKIPIIDQPPSVPANILNRVETYALHDPSCQSQLGLATIPTTTIDEIINGDTRQMEISYPGFTSTGGLASSAVRRVYIDAKYTISSELRLYPDGTFKSHEVVGRARTSQGTRLNVCGANPPRESLEYEAFTALGHIEKAAQFFNRLNPQTTLEQIELEMFPSAIDVTNILEGPDRLKGRHAFYITDNASYASMGDDTPVISVYPREVPEDGSTWRHHLWRSPFVMAHEYGHHVFSSLIFNESSPVALKYKKALRPHTHIKDARHLHRWSSEPTYFRAAAGFSDSSIVAFQALNEGFSDLFGFYVNDQQPNLALDLNGLGYDREVPEPLFETGEDKRFTTSRAEQFLTQTRLPEGADFTDIYTIGAIFAHSLHKLWDASDPKSVLTWAESLRSMFYKRSPTGRDFLGHAIDRALWVAGNQSKRISAEQCDIALEHFMPFVVRQGSNIVVNFKTYQCL